MADSLTIGSFQFAMTDLPAEMPLGGKLNINKRDYPGGVREIQVFGPIDDTIVWDGTFLYDGALQKAQTLDSMWRSGKTWSYSLGSVYNKTVIISAFQWKYKNQGEIDYHIELETAPAASILIPGATAAPAASTSTAVAPTAPRASSSPKKQTIWLVKKGDTLSGIAKAVYKDASQYRKIVAANPIIKNPNLIQPGWKLVCP